MPSSHSPNNYVRSLDRFWSLNTKTREGGEQGWRRPKTNDRKRKERDRLGAVNEKISAWSHTPERETSKSVQVSHQNHHLLNTSSRLLHCLMWKFVSHHSSIFSWFLVIFSSYLYVLQAIQPHNSFLSTLTNGFRSPLHTFFLHNKGRCMGKDPPKHAENIKTRSKEEK